MANAQDEVISSTNVGGQTSNNAFGALGTITTTLDRNFLRSITQHSKSLDFSLSDSSRLEGEFNYQVWSFRMARIFEKHHI
jgi:hypothetical protein